MFQIPSDSKNGFFTLQEHEVWSGPLVDADTPALDSFPSLLFGLSILNDLSLIPSRNLFLPIYVFMIVISPVIMINNFRFTRRRCFTRYKGPARISRTSRSTRSTGSARTPWWYRSKRTARLPRYKRW